MCGGDRRDDRRSAALAAGLAGHVRIGHARAFTVRQSLDTQTDSLKAAGVTRIFSEKISTRAVSRPELDRAVALAGELRASGSRSPWSCTSTSASAAASSWRSWPSSSGPTASGWNS
jgi:hypothetical protein